MSRGRPTKYTEELANEICELISTTDKGLNAICKELGLCAKTVFNWINDNDDFLHKYARAREVQAEYLADQIIEIADDKVNDYKSTENGEVVNSEAIARSRLRVDARKWKASKLAPKKFGDKVDVTSDNKPINTAPPVWKFVNGKETQEVQEDGDT